MKVNLSSRPRVFLSYGFDDEGQTAARKIAEQVRELGGQPVMIVDQVVAGEAWKDQVHELIVSSNACIVVVSAKSSDSNWQREEWSYIQQRIWDNPDFKIIPVRVGDARLPPFLSRFQQINLSDIDTQLGHALQKEFEADDNSVELSGVAKEERIERYGSIQTYLEKSLVGLPEEFSDYSKKYLKE